MAWNGWTHRVGYWTAVSAVTRLRSFATGAGEHVGTPSRFCGPTASVSDRPGRNAGFCVLPAAMAPVRSRRTHARDFEPSHGAGGHRNPVGFFAPRCRGRCVLQRPGAPTRPIDQGQSNIMAAQIAFGATLGAS